MSLLKDFVSRGIYYQSIGITDYVRWSEKMLDYWGYGIAPYVKDIRKWSVAIQNSSGMNKAAKLNCWQFMGCRLEKRDGLLCAIKGPGICPVLSEKNFDGVHGGINGGRACWIVSNTMCYGKTQGTYEEKYETCTTCDFYRSVLEEEDYLMSPSALKAMLL